MTPAQILAVMPYAEAARATAFAQPLTDAMAEHGITTPKRMAAFVAQCAHESVELRDTHELASGEAYEGRADLGNTQPGDGVKFKGRGLLQITGRLNYVACGAALGLPLIETPVMLEEPGGACRSAAWYWVKHGLSELADGDKFGEITVRINGGHNGLDQRIEYWLRARRVLGL
jgi:putative chitinase